MNTVILDDEGQATETLPWLPGRIYRHQHGDLWVATDENDLVSLRTGETYADQGHGFGMTGLQYFELLPPGTRVTITAGE